MLKKVDQNDNLRIPYGLSVYDNREIQRVVKVLKEHRSNMGIETKEFEERVAKLFGTEYGVMVNSGSSANLIATELLNLSPGDEVITPVLTFSTTVAPLVQKGIIPVFIDVKQDTYQIDESKIEKSISRKTKALFIPLLLGNLPDLKEIKRIVKKHNLTLVIDSCDTLGPLYDEKPMGYYADIVTNSFFGSHAITAGGNGGMVLLNKPQDRDRAKVLRGWGRSSSLFGETEDVEKRFALKIDGIRYDAKFIFQDVGYNLLPMEIGSAFGNEQLNKFPKFKKIRRINFKELSRFFSEYQDLLYLPKELPKTQTAWHVYPLTIKDKRIDRIELMKYLEANNIQTRPIFTGNILRQPGFSKIKHNSRKKKFPVADHIMGNGILIGVHHGMEEKHLKKMKKVFEGFLSKFEQVKHPRSSIIN